MKAAAARTKLAALAALCAVCVASAAAISSKASGRARAAMRAEAEIYQLEAMAQKAMPGGVGDAAKHSPTIEEGTAFLPAAERLIETSGLKGKVLSVRQVQAAQNGPDAAAGLEITLSLSALNELLPLLDALAGQPAERLEVSHSADANVTATLEIADRAR